MSGTLVFSVTAKNGSDGSCMVSSCAKPIGGIIGTFVRTGVQDPEFLLAKNAGVSPNDGAAILVAGVFIVGGHGKAHTFSGALGDARSDQKRRAGTHE